MINPNGAWDIFLGLWDSATFGCLFPGLGLWSVITCNVNYAIDNCKEGNGYPNL